MAPPTRLRPHLNDLLQKNLELEHVVADLRHQLTQFSAKWADERKTLAVGCDSLMASFAKFRARLDVQPSDWADSEGEVEQNLDAGRQSEEADSRMPRTRRDQGTEFLRERCRALVTDLEAREEELEESRRKRQVAEEELQRIQRLLDTQSEQLREALASSKADINNRAPPDGAFVRADPSNTGSENTGDEPDLANQEINRLKQLLQEWMQYGSEWKQESQTARVRASELQRREDELTAQVKAAEESKALQDAEIQELNKTLADQTAVAEQQRNICRKSVKQVQDLEAMVARLRARLSPEQLASFDAEQSPVEQSEGTPGSGSTQSQVPPPDSTTNKRSDPIVLKIPYRGAFRRPAAENNEPQTDQQNVAPSSQQAPVIQSIRLSPAPERTSNSLTQSFNATDFELCIHTCTKLPCRNDSRSFLWPRKQPSLPRHVLSTRKHHLCSPDCPGYRLLNMPLTEAMAEPRKAKCRPPTVAELALAIEEASKTPLSQRTREKKVGGEAGSDSSEDGEEVDEPEGGSPQGEETQERGQERPPRISTLSAMLGKRLRSRTTDEESQRARKLRTRTSITGKP